MKMDAKTFAFVTGAVALGVALGVVVATKAVAAMNGAKTAAPAPASK